MDRIDRILSSLYSSFANYCSIKSVSNENNGSQLTRCWLTIFDSLVDSYSFSDDFFFKYLSNTVHQFHKRYGSSIKTLLLFDLLLFKFTFEFIASINDNSFNVKKLCKYLRVILDDSIDFVMKRDDLFLIITDQTNLESILNGISRFDADIKELLLDLHRFHVKNRIEFSFDLINRIESTHFGSSINLKHSIINGIFLNRSLDRVRKSTTMNGILLNSNLSSDFYHLGFNSRIKIESFKSNALDLETDHDLEWFNQVKNQLVKFNINIIFTKEIVSKDLKYFLANQVLIMDNLFQSDIISIQKQFQCKQLIYLSDLDNDFIFGCVVEPFGDKDDHLILRDPPDRSTRSFSIILNRQLHSKMHKENLERSLRRFYNIFSIKKCLKGNGLVEKLLGIDLLNHSYERSDLIKQKLKDSFDVDTESNEIEQIYVDLAKDILGKVFRTIYQLISSNDSLNEPTFDDIQSKLEAWKIGTHHLNEIFFLTNSIEFI